MKKIYLSLALFASLSAVAQKLPAKKEGFSPDRSFVSKAKKTNQDIQKAEGDTLWLSGFETAGEWAQTLGTGQSTNTGSNPGWELLTAIPTGITSQQAGYQWPANFSGATGNFAFINSDGAGATGTQDAYFGTVANIDLSAAGTAALYLTFSEYYRNYLETTSVEVSIDGGTTWTVFEVNPEAEVPVNTAVKDIATFPFVGVTPLTDCTNKGASAWVNTFWPATVAVLLILRLFTLIAEPVNIGMFIDPEISIDPESV